MTTYHKLLCLFAICIFLGSCGTTKSPYLASSNQSKPDIKLPKDNISHRLYLIGDSGGLDDLENEVNSVFEAARVHIANDPEEKSLVFLGDNIYERGLGEKDNVERVKQEKILNAHIALSIANDGTSYIIPGNHDWNNNESGGLKAIQRQYDYIKSKSDKENKIKFYPKDGCGDPEVIEVNKKLVYVFIDSQWWVHDWSQEERINKGCKIKSRREFLDRMKDILIENKNKKIMIMLHHPFLSNGPHGGSFGIKDHLFPLTKLNKNLWLPVPFIGSALPLFRQLGGTNQDVSDYKLNYLKRDLEKIIRMFDVSQAIFISGHDHHLQHSKEHFIFQKYPIHYIVSGSGYKTGHAVRGQHAEYVHTIRGYAVMHFYENGGTWLDFYSVDANTREKTLEYRKQIYSPKPSQKEFNLNDSQAWTDKVITLAPNEKFKKGAIYQMLMGSQYRETWTTPVETEVFGLNRYHNGLLPVKAGGGLFSKTLRLEGKDGKQYVMRSMNKDFLKAVPKELQHLEVLKLYADQSTASIPYGALYIAALSERMGIYHAGARMVYLEDPSQLGPFESVFPKGHYLLEARPDDDWSDSELFGGSEQIVGYNDLLFNLRKKSTHLVDQKWVLKSRLLDMFIHDRDRHDDQWRWAAFKENDRTVYRPIPRDRDWAFFKYGGLFPGLFGNFVDKRLKSFKANTIDIKALATNANNFDRFFLDDLEWEDWEEVIDDFLQSATDEAIDESLLAIPPEIRPYLAEEIIPKLKSRKEIFKKEVKKYYEYITKELDFVATDEEDVFEVNMEKEGTVQVRIFRDSKKNGLIEKHSRKIYRGETEEIRLYGLAGKDVFKVRIEGDGHPRLRIIGGIGKDSVVVHGDKKQIKHLYVYDEITGMVISDPSLVRDERAEETIEVNEYDRLGTVYNSSLPWLNLGYAPDVGVSFGFGFVSKKHGWREKPFKASHFFNGSISPGNRFSLRVKYNGEFPNLFGKGYGFAPSFGIEIPDNFNFFGIGQNEFLSERDNSDNWIQFSRYTIKPHAIVRRGAGGIIARFGPSYDAYIIQSDDDPFNVTNVLLNLSEDTERTDHLVGLHSDIEINTLDRPQKPSRGVLIKGLIKHQYHLEDKNHTLKLGGHFAWFSTLSHSKDIVFGSNTGFETILGDPLFYQFPAMGNNTTLRPYRNERFRGETILYQQFDLRFRLFNWNNSILPVTIGAIGGYDLGQTYFEGMSIGPIRHGWTTGFSYDFVNLFVLRTSLSKADEGLLFKFAVGYAF